jgi:two-component system chemotaxis response regulator CheB
VDLASLTAKTGNISAAATGASQDIPAAPGRRVRVLVVDDSVVARRLISQVLAEDAEIEVCGTASTAELALQKLPSLQPDLITLDINMPGMSGLELLPILRDRYPALKVLMVSTLTLQGATSTMDALMLGASDYVSKPLEDISLNGALDHLRREIVPKVKQLAAPRQRGRTALRTRAAAQPASLIPPVTSRPRARRQEQYEILAVGVSTGGPTALAAFMAGFPLTFPLPIVIVQHMPPVFTRLLADRLSTLTGYRVVEATPGMALEPGKAIIAAGDHHMRIKRTPEGAQVVLDQGPQECSCRPSVDVLFRSVAEVYGSGAIATVLTGMGQDGLRGAEELKRAGAHVIAQDEGSSVVWGMPGAIAGAGLADEILDLNLIAKAILKKTGS